MTGNNIVPIQPSTNVQAYRASTDAADLCRGIVLSTAMEIQRRRYVKVEGWQAIAIAHGCTASARGVEKVDGGVRAIGEVRRMSDGHVIAEGEGFVGEDEATWYGGEVTDRWGKTKTLPKRPDFAIRAMAQTRAISRACRSAFAHVVVMIDADLSTTPAEEVPVGGFDNGEVIEADFDPVPQPRKSAHQARKDGDYERLTTGLRACQSEQDLHAWAKAESDALGAIPAGWAKEIRQEWVELRDGFRARSADPYGLFIEPPADDTPEAWAAYVDEVLTGISGAPDVEQVTAAQTVNAEGLTLAMAGLEGVAERIAEAAEQRLAFLASRQEEAA
jgi:hypothetical protein